MQSLSRALTVLAELNREDRAYGVTELAGTVGLHKSTVHRILATFCEHGLAARVDDHRYTARDGLAALRPTSAHRRTSAVGPDAARWSGSEHSLMVLGDRLGRLVVLAKPLPKSVGTVLQVAAVAGGSSVQPGHAVSLRQSALGRAYLSALPADQVTGTPDLLDTLQRIRVSGFAHNARPVASLPRMVAVPVRASDGQCAGSLGAELMQAGSVDEVRRVVSVLRSGV
ncbi:helix-turn-helix domain-containing protein [Kribbella shirazensis]|uniref:DNA-binding IclR family transcriptional regulator n=1 Tax=Kribbella shirazensis TaxID=1105143 RepID=A0A7X5VJ88_9ACTN|nr:helix-turn-helix domain-containing protein [Kribbella shirazensis]NIK61846.1 DNA-binding IclR family transcriptional regulator [Kribbella shirazensis]